MQALRWKKAQTSVKEIQVRSDKPDIDNSGDVWHPCGSVLPAIPLPLVTHDMICGHGIHTLSSSLWEFCTCNKGFTLMWGLWKIRPVLQSSGDNGPDSDKAKGWKLLVQHKRSWQVDHWLIPVRSTEVEISKQEARNPERQAPESDSAARILQHTSSQRTKEGSFATWIHGYKSETVLLCPLPHAHTPTHTKRLRVNKDVWT